MIFLNKSADSFTTCCSAMGPPGLWLGGTAGARTAAGKSRNADLVRSPTPRLRGVGITSGKDVKRGQPDLLPPKDSGKKIYQLLRPPRRLSRPPLLSRRSIGLASLTVKVRPSSSVLLSALMAFCASLPELISTKPKPRDWPLNLSVMTRADSTVPCAEKTSLNRPSVTENGKPPTYNLVPMFSSYERLLESFTLRICLQMG